MKILLFIFILFQNQFIQLDTSKQQLILKDSSVRIPVIIETVKIFTKDKSVETQMNETWNYEIYLNKLIKDYSLLVWKFIIVLALIILMVYLSYQLNKFYNKYNLSTKIKNVDFFKVVFHILIWLITFVLIGIVLLKSSPLILFLFLIFIFFVLILSVSDIARNIIGGILILIDKPFEYGDLIRVGEYSGKVRSKNLRDTEIITEDDSLIKIPNSYFITNTFENLNVISKNKQVSFVVEIPPQPEISKIKSHLLEIVSLSIYNSLNKQAEIIYKGINERGKMEFQIKAYVFDAKYESEFKSDVQESIAEIFRVS